MTTPWDTLLTQRTNIIEEIEAGVNTIDELSAPFVGPTQFDAMTYPVAQILPENTTDQGGNEFQHQLRLNCYFERQREQSGERNEYYLAALEATMDAVGEALACLAALDSTITWRPDLIEDFAGSDPSGTDLILISVRLQVTTLVDLAN